MESEILKINFLQTLTRLQSYAKDPLMLIIKKILNKRVTEGDASDPHDFIKTI